MLISLEKTCWDSTCPKQTDPNGSKRRWIQWFCGVDCWFHPKIQTWEDNLDWIPNQHESTNPAKEEMIKQLDHGIDMYMYVYIYIHTYIYIYIYIYTIYIYIHIPYRSTTRLCLVFCERPDFPTSTNQSPSKALRYHYRWALAQRTAAWNRWLGW